MAWTNNLVQKPLPWILLHTDTVTQFKAGGVGGSQAYHKHNKPSSLSK